MEKNNNPQRQLSLSPNLSLSRSIARLSLNKENPEKLESESFPLF